VIARVRPVAKAVAVAALPVVEPDDPLTLPVRLAVIVPALKLPDASRATIADAVEALAAVVAELLTLSAVLIVASLVSAILAAVLISALTITLAEIDVARPTLVTSPDKLLFV
jgi:hypothetical protein